MPTKSWNNHPQKLLRLPQIHFFFFTALTSQTAQIEGFLFQNVGYWLYIELELGLHLFPKWSYNTWFIINFFFVEMKRSLGSINSHWNWPKVNLHRALLILISYLRKGCIQLLAHTWSFYPVTSIIIHTYLASFLWTSWFIKKNPFL